MSDAVTFARVPAAPWYLAAPLRWPVAALIVLTLLAWLPGFASVPVLDRDEARFAQSSKQMVESGNWVDIRFGQESRYKKPIGIYWLQAAATKTLGRPPYKAIWTYRLPSLLGALAAVLLAFWTFRAMAPPAAALAGAAMLALALGVAAEAHIAKTDAVLLATALAAQGVLLRLYLAAREKAPTPRRIIVLGGWAALAVSVLIKGPVVPAVVALTAIGLSAWDRRWRWLGTAHPLPGAMLLVVLVMPWFVAIGIASHGAFFAQSLGHDFASKLAGGQESHGAPPGYYILLSTISLWPATLAAIPGLGLAWARRREPGIRFLLVWAVVGWAVFEFVPTKLPHYILPVYPALAGLGGLWLFAEAAAPSRVLRIAAAIQFALGTLLLCAAIVYAPIKYGDGLPLWLMALAAVGAGLGLCATILLWRGRRGPALAAAMLAALVFYPTLMWGVVPRLTRIWLSPRLSAMVAKDERPGDPPVIASGYDEPSLIFLLGGNTRVADGREAATLAAEQGGLALIDDHQRAAFLKGLAQAHANARVLDQLSGINYSHGMAEHITIYRVGG